MITTIIFVTNGIRGAFTINTTIIFGFILEIVLFHNIVCNLIINNYVIVYSAAILKVGKDRIG